MNFCIMVGVTLPPIVVVWTLRQHCDVNKLMENSFWSAPTGAGRACALYYNHPIAFVNLVYFIVVDIVFWLIYLVQQSTWLIDPHWQIIPACIACFYFTHPTAVYSARALTTFILLLVWACRLMYNYVRREECQFGAREDWRYSDMRTRFGKSFSIVSFFAVSVAQHPMLVGMTLPLCATCLGTSEPLSVLDVVAFFCCAAGISIAHIADAQLFAYMAKGANKPLLFDDGLWRYSRHPNHFGEQLWWIGLALFGVSATGGAVWPLLGVLYNHPIDILATLPLIEERMLKRPERHHLYKAYQARTSLVVLWPPKAHDA